MIYIHLTFGGKYIIIKINRITLKVQKPMNCIFFFFIKSKIMIYVFESI